MSVHYIDDGYLQDFGFNIFVKIIVRKSSNIVAICREIDTEYQKEDGYLSWLLTNQLEGGLEPKPLGGFIMTDFGYAKHIFPFYVCETTIQICDQGVCHDITEFNLDENIIGIIYLYHNPHIELREASAMKLRF